MLHFTMPGVCKARGKHWYSKPSQDAPWLSAAENIARADKFGDRRYWHAQCRVCGKKLTYAIEERQPGARESKRLLVEKRIKTHATFDPRQMQAPLKLRDGGEDDAT